jgi:hypothetical protein
MCKYPCECGKAIHSKVRLGNHSRRVHWVWRSLGLQACRPLHLKRAERGDIEQYPCIPRIRSNYRTAFISCVAYRCSFCKLCNSSITRAQDDDHGSKTKGRSTRAVKATRCDKRAVAQRQCNKRGSGALRVQLALSDCDCCVLRTRRHTERRRMVTSPKR